MFSNSNTKTICTSFQIFIVIRIYSIIDSYVWSNWNRSPQSGPSTQYWFLLKLSTNKVGSYCVTWSGNSSNKIIPDSIIKSLLFISSATFMPIFSNNLLISRLSSKAIILIKHLLGIYPKILMQVKLWELLATNWGLQILIRARLRS